MDRVRLPGEGQGEVRSLLLAFAANGYGGFLTLGPTPMRRLPEEDGQGRPRAAAASLRTLVAEAEGDGP